MNETSISREEFEAMDALERVHAIDREYGAKALLLSSMQNTAGVLMHMLARLEARTVIVFVDTQYHFHETLEVRDQFIERFGLEIRTVYPAATPERQRRKYGRELLQFVDGQPECCELRKEKPFLKVARELHIRATLAGLMRAESGGRKDVQAIGQDLRLHCPVFHPLFDWTYEKVDAYTREHDLPLHALYAQNFLSIGCAPCTTAVRSGEDRRAGRWRHLRDDDGDQPRYCNINFSDLGDGI